VEQSLVELAARHPGQVVPALLDQFVALLGGLTPNVSMQRFVRSQLCRRTVAELLSRGFKIL
jgi:hypothetical protein